MLIELLVGCGIYLAVGEIIILAVFLRSSGLKALYETVGFLIGGAVAMGMVIAMAVSIEKQVTLYEHDAVKKHRIAVIVRALTVAVIIVAMIIFGFADPIAALFGLFSLKVAAYLQPVTHKFFKYTEEGR